MVLDRLGLDYCEASIMKLCVVCGSKSVIDLLDFMDRQDWQLL